MVFPDLACFATSGPRLELELQLTHLDPALRQLALPPHRVVVGELTATCVPVARRGGSPAPAMPPTLQAIALACYRIDADALPAPVRLGLAPLDAPLALLAGDDAALLRPVELCLPVAPRGVAVPPDVRRLVQFVALECHALDAAPHPGFTMGMAPLAPELAGVPVQRFSPALALSLGGDREVCMPVAKNTERIPIDVLGVVQRMAFEKLAAAVPAPSVPAVDLALTHLNPRLVTLPAIAVALAHASGAMLPVVRRGPVGP